MNCKYHESNCTCYCKRCNNLHTDCICKFMGDVFEDEVGPPTSRSIMDLSSRFDRGSK